MYIGGKLCCVLCSGPFIFGTDLGGGWSEIDFPDFDVPPQSMWVNFTPKLNHFYVQKNFKKISMIFHDVKNHEIFVENDV